MSDPRVQRIVIVGGATAGWIMVIGKCVAVMPMHKDYFARNCAAGMT